MEEQQIYNGIRKTIAEIAEIKEESIKGDARLIEELDLDSLTEMAILAALELKFNVRFPLEQLQELHTLDQLVGLIKKLLANQS